MAVTNETNEAAEPDTQDRLCAPQNAKQTAVAFCSRLCYVWLGLRLFILCPFELILDPQGSVPQVLDPQTLDPQILETKIVAPSRPTPGKRCSVDSV